MRNLVGEYPEPPYFCHILHADISFGSFDIRNQEGEIKTAENDWISNRWFLKSSVGS